MLKRLAVSASFALIKPVRLLRYPVAVSDLPIGTLTQNELSVTEIYTYDDLKQLEAGSSQHGRITEPVRKTLTIGNLCNNAFQNSEGVNIGQSTDVALLNILGWFGLQDIRQVSTLVVIFGCI